MAEHHHSIETELQCGWLLVTRLEGFHKPGQPCELCQMGVPKMVKLGSPYWSLVR